MVGVMVRLNCDLSPLNKHLPNILGRVVVEVKTERSGIFGQDEVYKHKIGKYDP